MKVEAYFRSIKRAIDTVARLQGLGFKKAYSDIKDNLSTDLNTATNLAGTENSGSNSGLVLKSQGHISIDDPRKSPLEAANPMVSGMGGFEEITDFNCKVIVEVDSGSIDEVKDILSNMGGRLEKPETNIPGHLKGIRNEGVDI